jgi:hypothetical protein
MHQPVHGVVASRIEQVLEEEIGVLLAEPGSISEETPLDYFGGHLNHSFFVTVFI